MRRTYGVVIMAILLQFVVPRQADAWWEYIEPWSGPGWWRGPNLDARLFCLADSSTKQERVTAIDKTAAVRTRTATLSEQGFRTKGPIGADLSTFIDKQITAWTAALSDWERAVAEWERLAIRRSASQVVNIRLALPTQTDPSSAFAMLRATIPGLVARLADANAAPGSEVRLAYERALATYESAAKVAADTVGGIAQAYDQRLEASKALAEKLFFAPAAVPGFIISACKLNARERRKAALDIGMRFLWTNDDNYAGGEKMYFTTIQPTFSWRLMDDPRYDFVDYGVGAGFYWVSSNAFPAVRGAFLEPVRLDLHLPTNWTKYASAFIFRFSVLNFPGGFEPDVFLPSPDVRQRIASDWVKSYGIYIDTEVFRRRKVQTQKP
jgi:hypothetical protein